MKVQVAVQPVSQRLSEQTYGAWREKLRDRVEFKADVPFDKEEEWRIRILLASAEGGGEADTNVQVTPPGLGRWDLLLFALPFLGVGVQPPTASWGQMIATASPIFDSAWWYMLFPGAALLLTVLAFNLVGDGLQDALAPKTADA